MNQNDIDTLTDLHEQLREEGLHIIDFIAALCEAVDRETAAECCAELSSGGDMEAIGDIIKRIKLFGL
jgi:hypothetical protein